MKKYCVIISLFLCMNFSLSAQKESTLKDSFRFSGQASAWGIGNYNQEVNAELGMRYIPQINYSIRSNKKHLFDIECSLNNYMNASFDSLNKNDFSLPANGLIKPYRMWIRYSNEQLEIRAGLQKINFGSAQMLRPLMWFDRIDARDPLELTDGVYALLARYYFLNNSNIWLWTLYGNNETKGWEWASTSSKIPEFGGRIQIPIAISELGISYHHRKTNLKAINPSYQKIEENRLGIDYRIDWLLGSWLEASWNNYKADSLYLLSTDGSKTNLKNQESITLGSDYTFGIGNGLIVLAEHMLIAQDDKAFSFDKLIQLSALSFSYPIGMFDNLNAYFYFDWTNNKIYNFVNWQHNFPKFTLYTMAYWNPKNLDLPSAMGVNSDNQLFSGKGIQLMVVYNY